jgi:hypothetical protein
MKNKLYSIIAGTVMVLLIIIIITPARYECSDGTITISVNRILETYTVTPLHAYSNTTDPRVHDFTDDVSYIENNGKSIPIDKKILQLWNEVLLAQHVYNTDIDKTAVNELLLNTYTLQYSYGFYFDYPGNSDNDQNASGTCSYNILNRLLIY